MRHVAKQFAGALVGVPTGLLFVYDLVLLWSTFRTKHADVNMIIVYLYLMIVYGILEKCLYGFIFTIYMAYTEQQYTQLISEYGSLIGSIVQSTHFASYIVCLVISFHRLLIVFEPKNTFFFGKLNILIYCVLGTLPVFTLSMAMYHMECPVVYQYEKLREVDSCDRNPLSFSFAILEKLITSVSFFINFAIFLHGRFKLNGTYIRMAEKMGIRHQMSTIVIDAVAPPVLIMRKRRHRAMRELGMSSSAVFFIYEMGGVFMSIIGQFLSKNKQEIAPFVGHLLLMFHNFFVFFAATEVSRVVVKNFFGLIGVYGIFNSNIIYVN